MCSSDLRGSTASPSGSSRTTSSRPSGLSGPPSSSRAPSPADPPSANPKDGTNSNYNHIQAVPTHRRPRRTPQNFLEDGGVICLPEKTKPNDKGPRKQRCSEMIHAINQAVPRENAIVSCRSHREPLSQASRIRRRPPGAGFIPTLSIRPVSWYRVPVVHSSRDLATFLKNLSALIMCPCAFLRENHPIIGGFPHALRIAEIVNIIAPK